MEGTLVVRADSSPRIGTGHVMRCLALAQVWQASGGQAVFVMRGSASSLTGRLKSEGMMVRNILVESGSDDDAVQTIAIAREVEATWVTLDGYHFSADYQHIIKKAGFHLLFIDDYGQGNHYYADIVLNQNIHADEKLYTDREPYTRLLLGPRYILLRQEFMKWRSWQRNFASIPRKILVTLGL